MKLSKKEGDHGSPIQPSLFPVRFHPRSLAGSSANPIAAPLIHPRIQSPIHLPGTATSTRAIGLPSQSSPFALHFFCDRGYRIQTIPVGIDCPSQISHHVIITSGLIR
ncbi:hypothetical protein BDQ94DRAFT_45709 [Aspergillus welwitschiae]|uniref:Uncharacterized protein n=1 Tax=Aspergillus welwitschiae TaxID=1341132 RepID=A0A3F3QHK3_9EURO|nr:hypothetical protein BDQ94DRAFT_45709 [Aspergillus welwitschiae]RDH38585.1 hypothetical protein BDQ94DRAFT_45709 [Aspergillus welwitschiae]